jgi:hypothetical protein
VVLDCPLPSFIYLIGDEREDYVLAKATEWDSSFFVFSEVFDSLYPQGRRLDREPIEVRVKQANLLWNATKARLSLADQFWVGPRIQGELEPVSLLPLPQIRFKFFYSHFLLVSLNGPGFGRCFFLVVLFVCHYSDSFS